MPQLDTLQLRDESKYLPADGLQEGSHNVGLVGVGSQPHYDPPGIPSPVGGQQTPKSWHEVHTFTHKPRLMLATLSDCLH